MDGWGTMACEIGDYIVSILALLPTPLTTLIVVVCIINWQDEEEEWR